MLTKYFLYFFLLVLGISGSLVAQTDNTAEEENTEEENTVEYSKLPSIGIGGGTLSYFGELNANSNVSIFSQVRTGLGFSIEERFSNYFGAGINGLFGKLSYNERSADRNLNFETPVTQANLNLIIYLDNDKILKRSTLFTPYLTAGLGFLKFDPKGDLKDAQGRTYNYWSDGTIRNLAENDANKDNAEIINKDYEFETTLKSSNYPRNSLAFPFSFGLKLKLSQSFDANIYGTYTITRTDYLDDFKGDSKTDSYIFTGFSINYNLGYGNKNKNDGEFGGIDYKSLETLDTDGDGVNDFEDLCQNTPSGSKVDGKGCPIDGDHDGVPDFLDQEPNSKKGAVVDASGVTLTDEMMAQKMALDSVAVERNDMFNQNPSLMTLRQLEESGIKNRPDRVESPYILQPEFKIADANKDGYLSVDELMQAIDLFFEGNSDLTVERINKLIDYFFEQ